MPIGIAGVIVLVAGLALPESVERKRELEPPKQSTTTESQPLRIPSESTPIAPIHHNKPIDKRIIFAIVIVALALFLGYPTPHTRTKQEPYQASEMVSREEFLKTLVCTSILQEGQDLEFKLSPLQDSTRFELNLTCTQSEVKVTITGAHSSPSLYEVTASQHSGSRTGTDSTYYVNIINPTIMYAGDPAVVSGSIKAYHVYQVAVPVTKYRTVQYLAWLPWWLP